MGLTTVGVRGARNYERRAISLSGNGGNTPALAAGAITPSPSSTPARRVADFYAGRPRGARGFSGAGCIAMSHVALTAQSADLYLYAAQIRIGAICLAVTTCPLPFRREDGRRFRVAWRIRIGFRVGAAVDIGAVARKARGSSEIHDTHWGRRNFAWVPEDIATASPPQSNIADGRNPHF